MASWNALKTAIAEVIKANGNQEITGDILQDVLTNMVSTLGENATFVGVATPSTNPGVLDGPVFYFATEAGTYANFRGITLSEDGLYVLLYDGSSWSAITLFEGNVTEIAQTVWPLVTPFTASPSLMEYTGEDQTVTLSWEIQRKNEDVTASSIIVSQGDTTLYSGTENPGNVSTIVNTLGTTTFSLAAVAGGLEGSSSVSVKQVAPMYFGFSTETSASSSLITSLTKQDIQTSAAGTYTLTTSESGYAWFCVPSSMSISSVTLDGSDVPMEEYETASTSLTSYKCYRSSNTFEAGSYTFVINGGASTGTGTNITVDDLLSLTSENPVQNKVITEAIYKINSELFPLTITVSGGGVFETGTTQTITVSWSVKEGSDTVTPDTLKVNGESVTNTSTSKQFTDVTATTTYTVQATKDSTTVSGSTTATFVHASYFGAVASTFTTDDLDSLSVDGLTKSVKNTKSYTGSIALSNQKTIYIYPSSLGTLSSIKDANNFYYIDSYTRTTYTTDRWSLDGSSVEYYVYYLTDATTITSFTQTFS